jgi:Ca-activated chloride channel homolog
MKTEKLFLSGTTILLWILLIVPVKPAMAQVPETEDKTLSPFFFVQSDDPSLEQLPLLSTSVKVNISGVIADATVYQVYKNAGKKPIEAIYIFPASTRAAVYGMKMTIGEREIIAVIQEKQQARQAYEQAVKEGKTASLLEQQRPNVFQMNVGNIMPGDVIKVEMNYTELLIPEDGIYEFVYPTVVGPRYSNQKESTAPPSEKWVANPYTREGEAPMSTFDIQVNLSTGLPIKDLLSKSHAVDIQYSGEADAVINLKKPNGYEGNKDYVLDYRLAGNSIETGLLLFQGKEENFFLAMIQPPARVTEQIVPAREYVFIMDVSGSMSGFPIEVSKTLLKDLISNLKPTDRFNVVLFAGASIIYREQSQAASQENINQALTFIDAQEGGGGTELLPALQKALAIKGTENYARTFIIATDGYVTVEKEAFDLIRQNLNKANFFAFGIGSSVNRYIIEGMAHAGKGEPFVVLNPEEAKIKAALFRKYIQYPVLSHIEASFPGFNAYDIEPAILPDVFAQRPVILIGKWKGLPAGNITLNGISGKEEYVCSIAVSNYKILATNSGLKYLWARERIRMLDDYTNAGASEELKEEITNLGLKYNLLTNFTSFIAIDSEVRNNTGNTTTVNQPLPLPEGVSNYAIGNSSGAYAMKSMNLSSPQMVRGVKTEANVISADEEAILEEEPIFAVVEELPAFNGGMDAFKRFFEKEFIYPVSLKGSGITGYVYLEFYVEPDGSISGVKVIRGLHSLIDAEAIRVLMKSGGQWQPGTQGGRAVKSKMILPISIRLK